MKLASTDANLNDRRSWLASAAQPPLAIVSVTTFWPFYPVCRRASPFTVHILLSSILRFWEFMPVMLADSVHVERPQSDSFMLQANIVNSRNAVTAPRRGYQIKMRVLNWACFFVRRPSILWAHYLECFKRFLHVRQLMWKVKGRLEGRVFQLTVAVRSRSFSKGV